MPRRVAPVACRRRVRSDAIAHPEPWVWEHSSAMTPRVIGWDVGGVNTKVARVEGGAVRQVLSVPFEIQRAPEKLARLIARLALEIGAEPGSHHAVTMTAELSQFFQSKREGVAFVLDAFESALPDSAIQVFGTDGAFRAPEEARRLPLLSAASNWVATASIVAQLWRDAVLLDIGSTTTDVVPVRDGEVVAVGRTDPDRLRTGELLYLGAIRTPVEAIVQEVPLDDGMAGVAAESFALAGDVYLWRGEISEEEYSVPTPDGRPATRAAARGRLARVVCADGEMLDDPAIDAIAGHVARTQVERTTRSLERVLVSHPSISLVVTAGIGSFLGRHAARQAGIATVELGTELGEAAARSAPAAAVAILLGARTGRSGILHLLP